jgi:hypothetical protein
MRCTALSGALLLYCTALLPGCIAVQGQRPLYKAVLLYWCCTAVRKLYCRRELNSHTGAIRPYRGCTAVQGLCWCKRVLLLYCGCASVQGLCCCLGAVPLLYCWSEAGLLSQGCTAVLYRGCTASWGYTAPRDCTAVRGCAAAQEYTAVLRLFNSPKASCYAGLYFSNFIFDSVTTPELPYSIAVRGWALCKPDPNPSRAIGSPLYETGSDGGGGRLPVLLRSESRFMPPWPGY